MKKIKNILIASELNKDSYEALAFGITLGLMFDAKISCIHVVKPSPIDVIKETFKVGSKQYGDAIRLVKSESEALLMSVIDSIGFELGIHEIDVELKIVSGNTSKCIVDFSSEINADIIVINSSTGSRLSRTPFTNLALNMIKLGQANVLLVPSGYKLNRIERFGAFVNFEGEDLAFIDQLIQLSSCTLYPLKLINVVNDIKNLGRSKELKRSFEKTLYSEVKAKKVDFELELGPVSSIVNKLKSNNDVDLLIIRAYKQHWNSLKPNSVFADEVIGNIKNPLLILKPKGDQKIKITKSKSYITALFTLF